MSARLVMLLEPGREIFFPDTGFTKGFMGSGSGSEFVKGSKGKKVEATLRSRQKIYLSSGG